MATELEKTSSSSLPNIPLEIIGVILSKLPAKSLLRFKTVSKSWNTIISDPVFVENHLQSSNSSNNLFRTTFRDSGVKWFALVKFEDGKIRTKSIVENIPNGFDSILCECNGVLLSVNSSPRRSDHTKYGLWNPSTRWAMCFGFSYALINGFDVVVSDGMCYNPITDDFKVVMIDQKNYAVYSCNNKSWTKKKLGTPYLDINNASGIFVDGATYWVLRDENYKTIDIVYFDPVTDELKTLQKPKELDNENEKYSHIRLACLRGGLCLYCGYRDSNKVRMWIKENKSSSWKEFLTIENVHTLIWCSEPLCFVENKLVIKVLGTVFVYYNPSENTVEEFEVPDLFRSGGLVPYRNSLYSSPSCT